MTGVKKTSDYSIFKIHEQNRRLDHCNLRKIIASIQARNLLEFRPILCDDSLNIIDGNHRLNAAMALGCEVYYTISTNLKHEDIVLLNANQRSWATADYLNYYVSLGNQDYKDFKALSDELGVPPPELVRLMPFGGATDNQKHSFKLGNLKMPPKAAVEELKANMLAVNEIILLLRRLMVHHRINTNSRNLRRAVLKLVRDPDCDTEILMKKLTMKSESLHKCADTFSYYSMLREVYNWRNQEPLL